MSESERVQRWRQRQREAGKKPRTIWLTDEENLRLEDSALSRRCSPSELVQSMLAQWHGETQAVTAIVTDTEQIRAIVQHELAQTHIGTAIVTDTVTATVQQMLPALVRALLTEQQDWSVTDTVTDTSLSPSPGSDADAALGGVSDTVADTVTATTSAHTAKRKAPSRLISVTDTVSDNVTVTDPTLEPFDTTKYVLGKLCPRGHAWGNTGQSLLKRTNRHCGACDREKFQERGKVQRQTRRQQRQQEGQG